MPDLSAFFPLIAIILGVLVAVGFIWGATRLMWKVAEPNEALIISGLTRGTPETRAGMDFKIVTGKGALVLPGLQTVRAAAEKEAEAAGLIADPQSISAIRQSVAQANAERARANAAQAGPLADATARQQVVVQETEVARSVGNQPGRGDLPAARREHAPHHRGSGRAVFARGPYNGPERRRRCEQDAGRHSRAGRRLPAGPCVCAEKGPGGPTAAGSSRRLRNS